MASLWRAYWALGPKSKGGGGFKDLFIGSQEFVVGYSKAPEQPQSSARPICHSHAMTRTGREPATMGIAALELAALRTASRFSILRSSRF